MACMGFSMTSRPCQLHASPTLLCSAFSQLPISSSRSLLMCQSPVRFARNSKCSLDKPQHSQRTLWPCVASAKHVATRLRTDHSSNCWSEMSHPIRSSCRQSTPQVHQLQRLVTAKSSAPVGTVPRLHSDWRCARHLCTPSLQPIHTAASGTRAAFTACDTCCAMPNH